jgi:hypothetical protein
VFLYLLEIVFFTKTNCHLGWITFAVAAAMQSCLLIMCIAWTYRQRRLGIDEFGKPLEGNHLPAEAIIVEEPIGEETPLLGQR